LAGDTKKNRIAENCLGPLSGILPAGAGGGGSMVVVALWC